MQAAKLLLSFLEVKDGDSLEEMSDAELEREKERLLRELFGERLTLPDK